MLLLLLVVVVMRTTVVASSTTTTMVTSSSTAAVVTSPLFTILANKDRTAIELSVLEFANGTSSFVWLLVENNTASFGTIIIRFENIGLVGKRV